MNLKGILNSRFICISLFWFYASAGLCGEADIVAAEVECNENLCQFKVTIQHDDEGWDHYVNRYEILDLEKTKILGFRRLQHPHVKEQPFTRSVPVLLDESTSQVIIRAFDTVHEYGGKELIVDVPME